MMGWLKRVVTQPRDEMDRWQSAARFAYDLGRYGARQLRQDRATQMAAALAFRTLFGLLPVLVVGTVLVRAVIGVDEFLRSIDEFLTHLNLDQLDVKPSGADVSGTSVTLADWLKDLVGQAANVNLAAIGWVGLALLIYAATGLMVTIEKSFNSVYRAPEGRAWTRRVPLYWFILTVSPVAIGITVFLNGRFENWIESVDAWQGVLTTAGFLWNVSIVWLFMFAVYALVPNTTVGIKPASVGAIVAVVLLEIGKRTLGAYLTNAFSISQLYGSLGLIPLFMFWVYLMWLAVLFGLEVSATLQMVGRRRLDELERKPESTHMIEPASVLMVMAVIADRFRSGHPATARALAENTSIPEATILRMLERLIEVGYLHWLDQREERAVTLAKPPEQISAEDLIDVGFQMVEHGGVRSQLLDRLRQAQKTLAAEATLATMLSSTGDSSIRD